MPLLRPFSIGVLLLITTTGLPAEAPSRLVSAPMPAMPGQVLTLCSANVGGHKATVTMKFVNVRTGAIVAQKSVYFVVPGAQNGQIDPCLSVTAESISAAGAQSGAPAGSAPPLVVGIVTVKKSFFAPIVSASIQVQKPGTTEVEAIVPLAPAGLGGRHHEVGYLPPPR